MEKIRWKKWDFMEKKIKGKRLGGKNGIFMDKKIEGKGFCGKNEIL